MADPRAIPPSEIPPPVRDRRIGARGHFAALWDLFYRSLRGLGLRAGTFYTTVGIFLIIGAIVAVAGTLAFAELGEHVRAGGTQAVDVAVLRWFQGQQTPLPS
jgi:hypothetical protein